MVCRGELSAALHLDEDDRLARPFISVVEKRAMACNTLIFCLTNSLARIVYRTEKLFSPGKSFQSADTE
jgi:hypothetical protein